MSEALFLLLGLAAGAIATLLLTRPRLTSLVRERDAERSTRPELERRIAELSTLLESERRTAAERAELKLELADAVKTLSAQTRAEMQQEAREESEQRRKAVEQTVAPLKEALDKVDGSVREVEKARTDAYGRLIQQVEAVSRGQLTLQHETANLVKALRAPAVRGRWGEMHLRRAVELAGLRARCDFDEQATTSHEGRQRRPDLVVHLPGGRSVVVDAKVPLDAYLEALEEADEERQLARMRDHARQVRDHVVKLSAKNYFEQLPVTPDFVLMFIPIESILGAALEHDPALLEEAFRRGVHLVTPTSLISNLRAAAQVWRDEAVAENARAVSSLGKELYERIATLAGHFSRLGRSLDTAVGHYNGAIGSLETRVLVSARRFSELGVSTSEEIPAPDPLDHAPRPLQAPEFVGEGEIVRVPPERPSSGRGPNERDGVADAA